MLSQNSLPTSKDFKKDALLRPFFNETVIYPHIDQLQKIYLL